VSVCVCVCVYGCLVVMCFFILIFISSNSYAPSQTTQTKLNKILKDSNITDVYVAGLAADFCVGYTALDAQQLGYQTFVVEDATRGACRVCRLCVYNRGIVSYLYAHTVMWAYVYH
jgi:hypothetical protein